MDSTPEEAQKGLLSDETFDLSTRSLDSTSTIVATPASPITTAQRRPGYQRVTSIGEIDTQYYGAEGNRRDDEELGANAAQGLAIPNVETSGRTSIPRVPVGGKGRPLTTRSADPLLSPVALRFSKRTSPLYDGILESSRGEVAHKDSLHEPFVAGSASEYLHTKASASTMRSIDPLGMAMFFPQMLFYMCIG
ncbi:hypothetical protein MMC08_003850 [Hypocenomyce scalaris]|nr:hypothetical protein [Hypocenomyce scalaris]